MEKQSETKKMSLPEEVSIQALNNRNRLLEAILDNMDTFICVKDSQGKYKYVNQNYHHLLNVSANGWKGKTDFELFDGEGAEKIRRNEEKVLRSGKPDDFEEEIMVDGKKRHFISYKIPMTNRYGFGEWVCTFATEITDFKKARPVLEGYELPA